jgi:hypothetical protein
VEKSLFPLAVMLVGSVELTQVNEKQVQVFLYSALEGEVLVEVLEVVVPLEAFALT